LRTTVRTPRTVPTPHMGRMRLTQAAIRRRAADLSTK
jgi:hypothetical protein